MIAFGDAVGTRPRARRRSRTPHLVTRRKASTTMRIDIFEVPATRSRNSIGTSATRPPVRGDAVRHFHLEAVATGLHRVEVDGTQRGSAVGPEPRGRVGRGEAQHQSPRSGSRCGRSCGAATTSPGATTLDVSGPDGEIGAAATACSSSGSTRGSWERSESISTSTSYPVRVPSGTRRGRRSRGRWPRAPHHRDVAESRGRWPRRGRRCRRDSRRRRRARPQAAPTRRHVGARVRCCRVRRRSGGRSAWRETGTTRSGVPAGPSSGTSACIMTLMMGPGG